MAHSPLVIFIRLGKIDSTFAPLPKDVEEIMLLYETSHQAFILFFSFDLFK